MKLKWIFLFVSLLIISVTCKKEDNNKDDIKLKSQTIELPKIEIIEVVEVTDSSAVCVVKLLSDGGANITQMGVEWGMVPDINQKTTVANDTGTFEVKIKTLSGVFNSDHYVRAFATNSKGTAYGEVLTFSNR